MSDASPPFGDAVVDGRAWRDFCERMARLGERILGPDFPSSPRDRAEGFRHLANQVSGWLAWAIGYPDAEHPAFFRQNDQVVRWGGPNVDQVTRRARVDGAGTYRVAGTMGACEEFILTVKDGDMHMERYGILSETLASELGIGRGDDFAIVLSAERPDVDEPWIALHPEARMLNLREYYFDWAPKPPAVVTIERLDTAGTAPPPLTPARVEAMLEEAATLVERSLVYWNDYVRTKKSRLPANTMGPPRHSPGGSSRIHYSFGFYDLAPDQALIIDAGPPQCRFWSAQLYTLAWFEPFDYANHVTSINHTQGHLSTDGHFRVVVAHEDPGVANWLDTEQRPEGMITHRWIDAWSEPSVETSVVPFEEVLDHLPSDTPRVDQHARRDEIRRRQQHVAWRYRT